MLIFIGITYAESKLEDYYVPLYIGKVIVVLAALIVFRSTWREIKFDSKWIVPSVLIGVVLCAAWIGIEKNIPYKHFLDERTAYDPFAQISSDATRALFFGVRFFGLVLLVPVMEEIFWRSFLLRFITKPEFLSLKVGEFSTNALLIGAALFGLSHPEWLPAVIFALAISLWLKYTKSLFACIVVHLVTNLALGIWVVTQRDWIFW